MCSPDEVLALLNSGAYSLAQMFHYNGRPLPAAVMMRRGATLTSSAAATLMKIRLTGDIW